MLTYERYHELLERDAAAFAVLIGEGDLWADVPACPGWAFVDLAGHLGGIHRWAVEAIRTMRPGQEPAGPRTREELHAWFVTGAATVLEVLRGTDPQTPAWNFGPPPRTAGFWSRRLAQETAVHLWDARQALGRDAPIDADLAVDGVDEVVTVFFPRQVRLERIAPLRHGLGLRLEEGPWYVLAGDGTDPHASADVTLTGPASAVLLALWGRAGVEGLGVEGDPALAREIVTNGLTP